MGTLATIGSLNAKMLLDPSGFVKSAGVVESRAMQMQQRIVNGATVIGTAIGAMGVVGLKIGDEYKAATDSIRTGTGATGDALAALEGSFKSVATRVPDSLGIVAQAVADVNTRTGATGEQLEKLSESFIDVSRLLKIDTASAIASVTRLYGDWGIAAMDQVATNDLLLRASQASGMQLDKLAQQMVQFGAPLRNIGVEFEGAVAMLSKWEKEGVNTELALGGLKIALGEFAKEGVDAKEGLDDLIGRIVDADTAAQAMALGVSKFGSRAGPDMVAAIREGRFEFADFTDQLVNGTETVQRLSDDTRDMGDTIREALNRAKVAIGPFTDGLAGIADAMGNAIYLLPALTGALGRGIGKLWIKVAATGAGKAAAAAAGALAGAAYTAGAFVVGKFVSAAIALWNMMGGGRVVALAAAAGTKAGAAYGAAVALAAKAAAIGGAIWTAAGAVAGGIMGSAIAAAVLPVVSLALVAVAAVMAVDLAHNIGQWQAEVQKGADAAVDQSATDAIANLENLTRHMREVQGLGRILGDTFGGEQEASGLLNLAKAIRDDTAMTAAEIAKAGDVLAAAAHEAGARGNEAVEREILAIAALVRNRTPEVSSALAGYADAFTRMPFTPPAIAGPIRAEFKLATAAVAAGFGSVKQALANPPQMISKDDRLTNMAARMKKVMANIRKATEADDPMAQRYWEKARAKQQQQIDKLEGKTTSSLADVKSAYKTAGVKVADVWETAKTKTTNAARTAADNAITETKRVPTAVENMDLTSAGTNLMGTWAAGIRAGIGSAVAAANEAAAAVAAVTVGTSPPPKGPLSHIDKGGRNVMEAWLSGFDPKRAGQVGARLAAAVAPGALMPAGGLPAMGRADVGGGNGDVNHFHIGVLVANEAGIDELQRRMDRRANRRSRSRRFRNDPN